MTDRPICRNCVHYFESFKAKENDVANCKAWGYCRKRAPILLRFVGRAIPDTFWCSEHSDFPKWYNDKPEQCPTCDRLRKANKELLGQLAEIRQAANPPSGEKNESYK